MNEITTKQRSSKLTAKMKDAIREFVRSGGSMTDAAAKAGVSLNGLSKALATPAGHEVWESEAKQYLRLSASKALKRVNHLIDAARSEYVQLEASKTVLDRAGLTGEVRDLGTGIGIAVRINMTDPATGRDTVGGGGKTVLSVDPPSPSHDFSLSGSVNLSSSQSSSSRLTGVEGIFGESQVTDAEEA